MPATLRHADGLTPQAAAERLGLAAASPPAIAYYVAAVREAFEETAILLGGSDTRGLYALREELLAGRVGFADVLQRSGGTIAAGDLVYFAHWITPERSPRRYDTRFFAARLPAGTEAVVDGREMVDARWLAPSEAVREYRSGALPMILPTITTLERLEAYGDARGALTDLAIGPVPTIMPSAETGGFAGPTPRPRLPP